jgi:hypothetical protein
VPLFEGRDPDQNLIAVLSVFQLNWLARGQSLTYLIELVTISAQPADEIAVGRSEAFMKAVALPARVENRSNHAVFAACEHEANQITRRSAVAKEPGRAATEIGDRYGYDLGATDEAAPGREHRSGSGGRSDRECDNKQNRAEFRQFHAAGIIAGLRRPCNASTYAPESRELDSAIRETG